MANLQFIPQAASKNGGFGELTLEDVPVEVREEVEEVYTALQKNPGRMRASFETVDEMNKYIAQVKVYCDQRTDADGKPAPIRFRKSPSRGLPKTTMDFRITDVQTENEAITEGIRESVEDVKEAAKATTTGTRTARKAG